MSLTSSSEIEEEGNEEQEKLRSSLQESPSQSSQESSSEDEEIASVDRLNEAESSEEEDSDEDHHVEDDFDKDDDSSAALVLRQVRGLLDKIPAVYRDEAKFNPLPHVVSTLTADDGGDIQRLEHYCDLTDQAVKLIVNEKFSAFDSSIHTYRTILGVVSNAQESVDELESNVEQCTMAFPNCSLSVASLWLRLEQQHCMIAILDKVDNLRSAEQRINEFVNEKSFLHAANEVVSAARMVCDEDILSIPALDYLRQSLLERKNYFHDVLLEEIRNLLFSHHIPEDHRKSSVNHASSATMSASSWNEVSSKKGKASTLVSSVHDSHSLSYCVEERRACVRKEMSTMEHLSILVEALHIVGHSPTATATELLSQFQDELRLVTNVSTERVLREERRSRSGAVSSGNEWKSSSSHLLDEGYALAGKSSSIDSGVVLSLQQFLKGLGIGKKGGKSTDRFDALGSKSGAQMLGRDAKSLLQVLSALTTQLVDILHNFHCLVQLLGRKYSQGRLDAHALNVQIKVNTQQKWLRCTVSVPANCPGGALLQPEEDIGIPIRAASPVPSFRSGRRGSVSRASQAIEVSVFSLSRIWEEMQQHMIEVLSMYLAIDRVRGHTSRGRKEGDKSSGLKRADASGHHGGGGLISAYETKLPDPRSIYKFSQSSAATFDVAESERDGIRASFSFSMEMLSSPYNILPLMRPMSRFVGIVEGSFQSLSTMNSSAGALRTFLDNFTEKEFLERILVEDSKRYMDDLLSQPQALKPREQHKSTYKAHDRVRPLLYGALGLRQLVDSILGVADLLPSYSGHLVLMATRCLSLYANHVQEAVDHILMSSECGRMIANASVTHLLQSFPSWQRLKREEYGQGEGLQIHASFDETYESTFLSSATSRQRARNPSSAGTSGVPKGQTGKPGAVASSFTPQNREMESRDSLVAQGSRSFRAMGRSSFVSPQISRLKRSSDPFVRNQDQEGNALIPEKGSSRKEVHAAEGAAPPPDRVALNPLPSQAEKDGPLSKKGKSAAVGLQGQQGRMLPLDQHKLDVVYRQEFELYSTYFSGESSVLPMDRLLLDSSTHAALAQLHDSSRWIQMYVWKLIHILTCEKKVPLSFQSSMMGKSSIDLVRSKPPSKRTMMSNALWGNHHSSQVGKEGSEYGASGFPLFPSSPQSIINRNGSTSLYGAAVRAGGLTWIQGLKSVVNKFTTCGDQSLLSLRIEYRLHCIYYFRFLDENYTFSEPIQNPDLSILKLCEDLEAMEQALSSYLPHNKILFVFGELSQYLSDLLISSLSRIKRVNKFGVDKLLRNVLALHQCVSNICVSAHAESHFERARQYYELLLLDHQALLQQVSAHGATYSYEEYCVLLGLCEEKVDGEENSSSTGYKSSSNNRLPSIRSKLRKLLASSNS